MVIMQRLLKTEDKNNNKGKVNNGGIKKVKIVIDRHC